ncbi:MAG: phosphatase PAP2 family protein, partial [Oscillospiraceae bacterium]|nr:phosphatase PAP2 family protein [Oscillospiraceae bacterium]
MNLAILHFFNNLIHRSAALDGLIIFFIQSALFIIPLVIVAVYLIGIFLKKETCRTAALNAGCLVAVCLLLGLLIEQFVHEPRPMFALDNVIVLLPHANDPSFPSDHMLLCFSAAFGFFPLSKKLSIPLMGFGLLVGAAKIAAAQHYPSDILLTILLTLVISLLYLIFISQWTEKAYLAAERR